MEEATEQPILPVAGNGSAGVGTQLGTWSVRHAEGLDLPPGISIDLRYEAGQLVASDGRTRSIVFQAVGWSPVGLLLGADTGPYLLLWPEPPTTAAAAAAIPEWFRGGGTPGGEPSADAQHPVDRAIKQWITHLIDVGARNNLLYYRPLRAGSLDLSTMRDRSLEDLLAGKPVRLSAAFTDPLGRADAIRRAKTIHRKARENYEERGLSTLFGAFGAATWTPTRGTSVPSAPVLMRPATLAPRGAAQADFDLQLVDEFEVNPVLLHVMAEEFKVNIDPQSLLDRIDGVVDTPEELLESYRWLTEHGRALPAFSAQPRAALGNFLYAKLPMVKDLQLGRDVIAGHDILAAIAGDAIARDRVLGRNAASVILYGPDDIPPVNEFLVVDSDSSQNHAINLVRAGKDLIVKGPPGTGKSQTIANLIATLLADGKNVLFVAEKRAAIDAVFKRLRRVGLTDLLLDAHEGVRSRRELAEQLEQSLIAMAAIPPQNYADLHRELSDTRKALREHARTMGDRRLTWDLTVYEVVEQLTALEDTADVNVRFRGQALQRMDRATRVAIEGTLESYLQLGGASWRDSPWAHAPVDSDEVALALYEAVEVAGSRSRHVINDFTSACAATSVPVPSSDQDRESLLALWAAIAAVRATLAGEALQEDLGTLNGELQRGKTGWGHMWAALTRRSYRQALRAARALLLGEGDRARIISTIAYASHTLETWRHVYPGCAPAVPSNLAELGERWASYVAIKTALAGRLGLPDLAGESAEAVSQTSNSLFDDRQTLMRLREVRELDATLAAHGLTGLADQATAEQWIPADAVLTLRKVWLLSVLEYLEFSDPGVRSFVAAEHLDLVSKFHELDAQHLKANAQRIRRLYAERGIAARDKHPVEAAFIQRQARLRRRHAPLRALFRSAPHVLLAVKPCWAMSPLMVSQVLPSDRSYFDVVVFDEASQITPADAVTSIMRANTLVVAGDDKQLPPTAFFLATLPEEEGEDEVDDLELTAGFESVLDSLGPLLPTSTLDWHYRSQDEKLISFSNTAFYGNRLVTFPGARQADILRHVLVNSPTGSHELAEADRVVDLIIEHARSKPNESLGIIALGIEHALRIDDRLRQRLLGEGGLDDYFSESRDERFFVKNLERVQGDERDAIILSVGYGKGADGRMVYRFGPLNLDGGERRLNVAVTRARKRMTVVSSFSYVDLDPARTRSRGAALLREYLEYATMRGQAINDAPTAEPRDSVQRALVRRLAAKRIPVDVDIGASGQAVELGLRDSDTSQRSYRLAVELDGDTYLRSQSVRDRDRLRPQQLARLGWRYHRTYALEWHGAPDEAVSRVVESYRGQSARAGLSGREKVVGAAAIHSGQSAKPIRTQRPNLPKYMPINDYWPSQLQQLAAWVESDGLLRTEEEVLNEMVADLGYGRRGSRIVAALTTAIRASRAARAR